MFDLIKKNPNYSAFISNQLVNEKPKKYDLKKLNEKIATIISKDLIKHNPSQLNQLCYKASLNIYFPNERAPYGEDWYFTRILANNGAILKSNHITSRLIEHNQRSMTSIDLVTFAKSNFRCTELYILNSTLDKKTISVLKSFTYLYCSNILFSGKHKKEGLKYFKNALCYRQSFLSKLFYKALVKLILP